jgi:hypothetical protein
MSNNIQTKNYPLTLLANEAKQLDVQGEFYKLTQATGAIQIRRDGGTALTLQAGQGEEDIKFNRLEITNLTAGTVTINVLIGASTFIDDTVTIAQGSALPVEDRGVIGATVTAAVATTASGLVTLITPGANPSGMTIENCGGVNSAALGSNGYFTILRKSSAPANERDGKIVCTGWFNSHTASSHFHSAEARNVALAAGEGLYAFVVGSGVMAGIFWSNAKAL